MRDHLLKKFNWPEYGAEFLGTAFLLFAGLSAVILDFGGGSPVAHILPDKSARLLLTGLLFAGSGSLVAISPLGKLSGGHINPAVSLAFWLQGKMHHFDLGGYMLGQVLGAIPFKTLLANDTEYGIWSKRDRFCRSCMSYMVFLDPKQAHFHPLFHSPTKS